MTVPVTPPDAEPYTLTLGYVTTPRELEAVQRFRYQIYTAEMNVVFPDAVDGVDVDRYDQWCKHLMVTESKGGLVVGTYRVMSPENAIKAGGYYSESEFDLREFQEVRNIVCECGRSCTHPAYRDGSVIMLLWTGLTWFLRDNNLRYMLGCASVSLSDGGLQASKVWHASKPSVEGTDLPKLYPLLPYPLERLSIDSDEKLKTPPLIKGYLNIGARICGEPAWDKNFNSVDFPIVIDFQKMNKRYRKHFGID